MDEVRVAVVTGAAQGIGYATAVCLARAGLRVVAADIDAEGADRTASELAAIGVPGTGVVVDVGDPAGVVEAFDRVVAEFGRVDVLVNNAGVTRDIDFFELTADEWDRIMRINARGAFLCMQQAARYMRDSGGGRIVNVSSIAGKGWTGASNIAYAMSKGAVVTMTRLAAAALAPFDITVNAVCPGVTRTPLVDNLLRSRAIAQGASEEKVAAALHATIPIGRANESTDIADAIAFLTSDQARNITGQSLNVDGGIVWD